MISLTAMYGNFIPTHHPSNVPENENDPPKLQRTLSPVVLSTIISFITSQIGVSST
jgi:hypothetical protein